MPPLENGGRRSRAEFYRRWEAMPRVKFAERIEGMIYMQAAARREGHSQPHARMVAWLTAYQAWTIGVAAGDPGTIQVDEDNDPQPDAYLLIRRECGGPCRFTGDDYVEGAPERFAEISASSTCRELHQKRKMYERVGVRDCLVWKRLEQELVWRCAQGGALQPVLPDADGVYRSTVFPGLWLDATALLAGGTADVLSTLDEGLASREHPDSEAELRLRGVPR